MNDRKATKNQRYRMAQASLHDIVIYLADGILRDGRKPNLLHIEPVTDPKAREVLKNVHGRLIACLEELERLN